MLGWIQDRALIVTGGASGIGRSIVEEAATAGAHVVIADINKEMGEATAEELRSKGHKCHFIACDVTDDAQVKALIEETAGLAPLCYLANSAGLQTYGTVESTTEELWDRTMAVNLKSMYLTAHHAIPHLRKNGGGAVVNISSIQGMRSQKNVSAYATSKAGAIALTRCMGLDYAQDNIRVNCICPGSVDTPLLRFGAQEHGPVEEVLQSWGQQHPIGRIGTPEEIARLALFLMSPDASFIVGQSIVADGGLGSIIL